MVSKCSEYLIWNKICSESMELSSYFYFKTILNFRQQKCSNSITNFDNIFMYNYLQINHKCYYPGSYSITRITINFDIIFF